MMPWVSTTFSSAVICFTVAAACASALTVSAERASFATAAWACNSAIAATPPTKRVRVIIVRPLFRKPGTGRPRRDCREIWLNDAGCARGAARIVSRSSELYAGTDTEDPRRFDRDPSRQAGGGIGDGDLVFDVPDKALNIVAIAGRGVGERRVGLGV